MYAEYKRDVSHNYLILREEEKVNTASYQVRMLTGNVIPSILKCRLQGLDGNLLFYYDITSRQSLASFYEQRKFHRKDLHMLFGGFIRVMEEMAEFLMNTDQLLLCPEYIFLDIEKREVKFCCLPDYHHPIQEQFRELTEYLLPRLDHEDPQAVSMGYGVYRKAMETGFQLEHIKEAIYQNREVIGKNDNKDSAQKQGQKPPENNLDGADNFGEKIQEKADVSHLLETDVENKTSKRKKDKKKEESDFQKSSNEWTGALLCVFTAAVLIILLILRYLGYLPGIPAEAIFGGAIILLALAAFLSWTAEKKKQKKQMSAEWRKKVKRELDDTYESSSEKRRKERNSEDLYEADSVQEKMPEWGDGKYKMPEQTGETENYGETVVLSAGQTEGPASLVSREPGELATIYLDRDLMVIGKMENAADAVISLPTVSRIHAKIRKADDEYYLSDLNSRNGTSVNGRLLKTGEEYQLQDEDQVEFAQARYIFLK
ncbi:FHA domain-containing protein [Blautia sp. 2744]|uniref:FHA domain-containing protein n=1 Tax=Blautia intestinalis TaxID=2763028 RepID=A0ABR7I504_9FIRM|nr:DUF6382 domain-containing protein [Blautia intestinalis]MBC5741556.1 FHA domain-containing protein [Blautia intestinalis]RHD30098.1 FHA domain-containing protein [Blautia obeum]